MGVHEWWNVLLDKKRQPHKTLSINHILSMVVVTEVCDCHNTTKILYLKVLRECKKGVRLTIIEPKTIIAL